jgi:hypothetical protein
MKHNILEVELKDKFDAIHKLRYKIYHTPLSYRWVGLTKINLSSPKHSYTSVFNNRTVADVPEITERINEIVNNINLEYDKQLPIYEVLDNPKLNYLHEEFEIFGERMDELFLKGKRTKSLTENFFALNEHIHMCEDAMITFPNKWGGFGILYDILPLGLHVNIQEMDKLMLEPHYTWGRLYLGYNTLGKDWMAVWKDNDLDVINRDMVKPQKRFAAEAWMNFNIDQSQSVKVGTFLHWCNRLPLETQKKIPFHNLNSLTLGRFAIGDLIIDENFLKIDPDPSHWNTYRHDCKLKWNHEVLTTFRTVERVRIYEQEE